MKFDSATVPALKFLENNSLDGAIILQPGSEDELKAKMDLAKVQKPGTNVLNMLPQVSAEDREKFQLIWKYYAPKFRTDIFALTSPFLSKIENPVMKFSENFDVRGYGTIYGSFIWKRELQCFYLNEKLKEICFFSFGLNSLGEFLYKGPNSEEFYAYASGHGDEQEARAYAIDAFFQCAAMYYFTVNSPIGRIRLAPKERRSPIGGLEKLTNLTNLQLTYIDARWDNDIDSPNPFSVSGHERMQPIGEGRTEVKKIWISSYMKNGYSSKAGLRKFLDTNNQK